MPAPRPLKPQQREHRTLLESTINEIDSSLLEDLRGLTAGDVWVDDLTRAAYANDASILTLRPRAVVAPKSADELPAIVRYAAGKGISLHPRGAGTGLAGESLGAGIVLDTTRHLNQIISIGSDRVRVQPGVCFARVQEALASQGRQLAVDPISGDRCTIGGMLATNAAGPHSLRYGTTRDYVLAVRAVLASGDVIDLEPTLLDGRDPKDTSELGRIVRQLARVFAAHAQSIAEEQSPRLLKHGGYELRGIYDGRSIDLARLMAGSEGTLAIATEIELGTIPIPAYRGMLLAAFPSLQAAADAVLETLDYQPTACELLDRRLTSLLREVEPWFAEWIPTTSEALLMIEHEGSSPENVVERIVLNQNRLHRIKRLAIETKEVYGEGSINRCWRVRNGAMPRLTRSLDNVLPMPFVENTAVFPDRLPEFLGKAQSIMRRHNVTATYSAHAGVGILHARPLVDIHRPVDRERMQAIAQDMFDAVVSCGGTVNGEHGAGLLRAGLIPRQYPKLYPAFQRIKSIFDPDNTLNPGRIVGGEVPLPEHLFRSAEPTASPTDGVKTQLRWPGLSLLETAQRCNGCGSCQSTQLSTRMCPSHRAAPLELNSPRAMANLMRQVVDGALPPQTITSPEFQEVARACVYCKMCKLECPSSVDISKLMLEAKTASIAEQGMSRIEWFLAGSDRFAAWASSQSHFANRAFANPIVRWMLEKTVGLSRKRRMFRYHHRTFLQRARQRGWTRKPRSTRSSGKVAIFADTYTLYHDPQLGEWVGELLYRLGHAVYVPPRQCPSGMTPLRLGDIETARSNLLWNFEIAAELVREGYLLVTTEPGSALMFRDEAPQLIRDTDWEAVAEQTYEASEYLAMKLADTGEKPTGEIPVTIAYHEPCHQRALVPRASTTDLLRSIPGLRIVDVDLGCSGMAGSFGLRSDGFQASLDSGAAMLERIGRRDILAATSQCGACRMQIEQGAAKPTLHPAKLLAVSWGLVDQPTRLFQTPNRGLLSR